MLINYSFPLYSFIYSAHQLLFPLYSFNYSSSFIHSDSPWPALDLRCDPVFQRSVRSSPIQYTFQTTYDAVTEPIRRLDYGEMVSCHGGFIILTGVRCKNNIMKFRWNECCQGRGNYFEVGGGGQTSPGVQGNPYTKLKTPGFGPLFLGDPSSRAKTNKNKN